MTQNADPTFTTDAGTATHIARLLPATAPPPEPARKINFFKALLLHWILPGRYGPHLAAGSMKRAMAAHVISLLAVAVVILSFVFPATDSYGPYTFRERIAVWVTTCAILTGQLRLQWNSPELLAIMSVPAAELALVLLAILIMPWYAGGDRAWSVFKRSLKSVYWSTIILIPVAIGFLAISWFHPDPEKWLVGGNQALVAVSILVAFVLPIVLLVLLLLTGGTRYVGPPDGPAFAPREPQCEDCGYLIVGLPADARCPECGLPVRESLPGGRRRPTAWQEHEFQWRGFLGLLRQQWQVFARKDFFKQLPVQSGLPAARHFCWVTWALILAGTLTVLQTATALLPDPDKVAEVAIPFTLFAIVLMFLLQSLMMFAACLHGQLRYGMRDYRNSAIACYYAAPLMWPVPGLLLLLPLSDWKPFREWLWENSFLRWLELETGIEPLGFYAILIGLAFVGMLLFAWLRLCRALRDIRHANV